MAEDPYKVLQVDPEADPEVIQAAYRRLARKYHPDLAAVPDAAARMAALNRAWELIGEPAARAAYDRARAAEALRNARQPTSTPPAQHPRPGTGAADAFRSDAAGARPHGAAGTPPAETVSRDWTAGRSNIGGGYDPATMRAREGLGAAGAPPGNPAGSVLNFGRYSGWSLGEIARQDIEYLEWLDRTPIGRPYRDEVDAILRRTGRRRSADSDAADRRGLFRRR